MTTAGDRSGLGADVAEVEVLTQSLLATVEGFGADALGEPSLCDGWTRGHVLSHVARNADALARLTRWATTGEEVDMYPGGPQARDREIEDGARRAPAEQLEDLRESAARLQQGFEELVGGEAVGTVIARGGTQVPSGRLPFMRLRELAFHHVDLRAGYTFEDVPAPLLERFLRDAVRRLEHAPDAPGLVLRTDEGDEWTVGDGATEVSAPRAGLLLWLARRVPDGVGAGTAPPDGMPDGAGTAPPGGLPELPRGN